MRNGLAAGLVLAVVVRAWAADIRIVQKDERFSERELSARVAPFDIRQNPGRSDTVVLDTAGDLEIECAIHPRMRLKVKVEGKKLW
jgi:hypothetical protein